MGGAEMGGVRWEEWRWSGDGMGGAEMGGVELIVQRLSVSLVSCNENFHL